MSLNTILATTPLTSTGYHLKATGTTIGNSLIWDNGTNVGIGNTNTSYTLDVSGTLRNTTSAYFATASGSVGIGTVSPSDKFSVDAGTGNIVTSSFFNSTMTAGQSTFLEFGKNYSNNYNTGELAFKFVGDGSSSNMVSIGFYGAGNKLNVLGNGNVGIGVTPSAWGSGYIGFQVGPAGSQMAVSNNNRIGLNFYFDGSSFRAIQTGAASLIEFDGDTTYFKNAPSVSAASAQTFTERMRIASTGYITTTSTADGIRATLTGSSGTAFVSYLPSTAFYSAYFLVGGNTAGYIDHPTSSTTRYYTGPSDERLKSNIKNWDENVLDLFKDINPKTYTHNADNDESIVYKGFIAQEMVDKFPEAYGIDKDGYYGFNPSGFIPYLVKAIQEMNTKLDEQNQTIQSLQEQINILAK